MRKPLTCGCVLACHFAPLRVCGCRQYRERHCIALERESPEAAYVPFGFAAVISFPFHWAASFGEFGSQEWHTWGIKFQEAGIPVRSCVAHFIDLIGGAQA